MWIISALYRNTDCIGRKSYRLSPTKYTQSLCVLSCQIGVQQRNETLKGGWKRNKSTDHEAHICFWFSLNNPVVLDVLLNMFYGKCNNYSEKKKKKIGVNLILNSHFLVENFAEFGKGAGLC